MPGSFDFAGVAPDQKRDHVVRQVAGDRQFPTVERGITKTRDAVFRDELQRDEIPSRAANDDLGIRDSQASLLLNWFIADLWNRPMTALPLVQAPEGFPVKSIVRR